MARQGLALFPPAPEGAAHSPPHRVEFLVHASRRLGDEAHSDGRGETEGETGNHFVEIVKLASNEIRPPEATLMYLMAGGLRAVYWTDVIQGIWMYIAVWVGALYLSYELFGGPLELWRRVAEERPDLLTLPGPHGFFTPGIRTPERKLGGPVGVWVGHQSGGASQ